MKSILYDSTPRYLEHLKAPTWEEKFILIHSACWSEPFQASAEASLSWSFKAAVETLFKPLSACFRIRKRNSFHCPCLCLWLEALGVLLQQFIPPFTFKPPHYSVSRSLSRILSTDLRWVLAVHSHRHHPYWSQRHRPAVTHSRWMPSWVRRRTTWTLARALQRQKGNQWLYTFAQSADERRVVKTIFVPSVGKSFTNSIVANQFHSLDASTSFTVQVKN